MDNLKKTTSNKTQKSNSFAVFPDSERLDIGSNKLVAIFKYEKQAYKFGKIMWEKYFLVEPVYCENFK